MIPTYQVKAWQEDGWWLARVVAASDGADAAPLNALTQARTLTKIEDMARDLIATILDVDEGSFGTNIEYVLPDDIMHDLQQARGARGRDRLLACEDAMRGFRQEVTELLSDRASHVADCARRRSSVMAGDHPQR